MEFCEGAPGCRRVVIVKCGIGQVSAAIAQGCYLNGTPYVVIRTERITELSDILSKEEKNVAKVMVASTFRMGGAERTLEEAGLELVRCASQEEMLAQAASCDAILTGGLAIGRDVIDAAPRLRVISAGSAGVEYIDVAYATSKGVWVCNSADANASIVAEHAMYLLLALAKNGRKMDLLVREGNFVHRPGISVKEIGSRTLGLIGCGKIASRVGKMAHNGFGMNVLTFDPYIAPERVPEGVRLVADRDELLAQSDFVSVHLQLNDATRRSIGMPEFRRMKKEAFLINVSRGGVLREEELIEALREGVIAGAGLDVFETEPPQPDNGLLQLDNVILSPHCAPNDPAIGARMGAYAAENILAVLNGQAPPYPVNKV